MISARSRCIFGAKEATRPPNKVFIMMFRVVKTPNHEIKIDSSYKAQGRGCYLSKDKDIILLAQKKALIEKHLKVSDCTAIYDELLKQF